MQARVSKFLLFETFWLISFLLERVLEELALVKIWFWVSLELQIMSSNWCFFFHKTEQFWYLGHQMKQKIYKEISLREFEDYRFEQYVKIHQKLHEQRQTLLWFCFHSSNFKEIIESICWKRSLKAHWNSSKSNNTD